MLAPPQPAPTASGCASADSNKAANNNKNDESTADVIWPSAGGAANDDDLDGMWPSANRQVNKKASASGGASAAELEALETKLKQAKEEHEKDKQFYEDALEQRMN